MLYEFYIKLHHPTGNSRIIVENTLTESQGDIVKALLDAFETAKIRADCRLVLDIALPVQ